MNWGRAVPLLTVLLVAFLSLPALPQQSETLASLSGIVRDAQGNAAGDVEVRLQSGDPAKVDAAKVDPAKVVTTRTNSLGKYQFAALSAGVYVLSALTGQQEARISSLFLAAKETKTVDLTLAPAKSQETSPQFFDEPQFTVAGVTDTTSLGGHGSDTVVRTRDKIAKETVSLGKSAAPTPTDMAAAEKSLRQEVEREPNRAELHHQLAGVEEKSGNPLEAVRQYQRAAELNPSEPYLFDWGSELLLHHAPEPAIEVFTRGNQLFPKSTRMLIGLGAAQFARGSNEEAVREICAASDLEPDDPAPYLFLGKIQRAVNTASAEVAEKLHRFVTLQPQNAEANYYYAVALWKQQKNSSENSQAPEIELLLNRAVQLDPNFAAAYLQLGIVRAERSDHRGAIAALEQAIQSDPEMEEAHYRLAQAYRQVGEAKKAKKEFQIYSELDKQSMQSTERERHEIRQFVYTLRDRRSAETR